MQNKELPQGWETNNKELYKKFEFSDFKEAMDFVNKVAELSEEANHHPDISISYNEVGLRLTTHSEGDLTEKDFNLASQIENL